MKPKIKDICQIVRYAMQITVETPASIFINPNFTEQQEALRKLLKDPTLEVTIKNKDDLKEITIKER